MRTTMMASLAKQIAKISTMSVKAKAITAAAVVVVGTAAGGTTYAVVQHNKAAKAEELANKYQIQIIDGEKIVVGEDGKAAKDLSVDKDGNIVDGNNKVIVAADKVKESPAKKDPTKKDPAKQDGNKTKPSKPEESKKPDSSKPEENDAVTPQQPDVQPQDDGNGNQHWEEPTPNDPTAGRLPDPEPTPEPEPAPEPDAPVTIAKEVFEYGGVCYKPSRENTVNWMVFDDRPQAEQAAHPLTLWLLGNNGEGGIHCEFVAMNGEFASYDITETGARVEIFEDGTHQYGAPGGLS